MAHTTVTINDATPNPNNVTVGKGTQITFVNQDDEAYSIEFPSLSSASNIFGNSLPFTVPASGQNTLHIKGTAQAQAYTYQIKDSDGEVVWPVLTGGPGNVPPEVIIT